MKRRDFIQRSTLAAGALVWPGRLDALVSDMRNAPASRGPWDVVREAFMIPEDRIYLNVGTLGAQPRVVVDAVVEHTRRVAMTYPPGVQWDALKSSIGALLNGDPDGFVFPRNTTEAMNFVANGLELSAGDEVLTTTHEHIGGLCCWQLLAARRGVGLRQLELPVPARSDDGLIDVFRRAITPRTRVISVSHVTFTNGTIMPVAAIAALCRERGIICVIDGAHPPGMIRVDLRTIDADFYASSPHKWLCAPQGTGLLYMREEWRTRLWPTLASGGWDDLSLGAHRLNHMGTMDESRLAGLDAAIRLHEAIGPAAIEARIRELDSVLLDALASVPGVRIMSPTDPALGVGLISFTVDGIESLELQRRLGEQNVRTRVVSEYGYGWMRLSPHIYNSLEEVEGVVEVIASGA
ncbi:MAG TPA: aminotransferase class V-fold PLP-dependent enzyme [Longimicrobiales bacterium]|nr:aminotransferase class V-fold PLP-dependent enzyme [Longimicrobiales bacterium]